jgi:outer membrane lipoprotein LolB
MKHSLVSLRVAALAFSLLLNGCAGLAPQTGTSTTPTMPATARKYVENIDLVGRLSVRYRGAEKEEALHGNFNWAQTPTVINVTLLSPLGQTVAIIEVTPMGARLLQADKPPRSASDVNELTLRALGWPLPIAGLREWLQGFAVDRSGRPFVAMPGRDELTTSDGWHLSYATWQDSPIPLPKRIDLERNTTEAGLVSIRIVIDSWQPH